MEGISECFGYLILVEVFGGLSRGVGVCARELGDHCNRMLSGDDDAKLQRQLQWAHVPNYGMEIDNRELAYKTTRGL